MVGSSSADKESRSHPSSSPSSWWLLCCRNCISCSSSSEEADKEGGHQEEEEKHGGWRAMPFILGNETFERLAVFGLFANFVVYLTRELHVETVSASNIMNIWFGVTNFAPLLGAYISDAYVDRAMFNGENAQLSRSYKRITSIGRIKTPRSPSRNTFESAEDSDDEGPDLENDDRIPFYPGNTESSDNYGVNTNICSLSAIRISGDDANCVNSQMYSETIKEAKASADMQPDGKSGSTSVNLVGNGLTFSNTVLPPGVAMQESTNIEEDEVCKMLRECLNLRKKYVYREKVAPWKAEPLAKNSDPYHFEPVEPSPHHFRMEDGVVHVYASENGKHWKWHLVGIKDHFFPKGESFRRRSSMECEKSPHYS